MKLLTDEYTGGKVNYLLSQRPLEVSYVWVYKNGQRLTQDVDYYVSLPRGVVYLNEVSTADDLIKIITFGTSAYRLPSAFEIHKDMLNVYHYKRHTLGEVTLIADLMYYDQSMTVSNAIEFKATIEYKKSLLETMKKQRQMVTIESENHKQRVQQKVDDNVKIICGKDSKPDANVIQTISDGITKGDPIEIFDPLNIDNIIKE
jgi:hypothetical protein